MDIYVVTHCCDNGLYGDMDYMEWEEYKFFSTLKLAESEYYNSIIDEYEGRYKLSKLTLDTQERILLEESPFRANTYYDYDPSEEYQPDQELEYEYEPDPCNSIRDAWDYMEMEEREREFESQEEDDEYLSVPHDNYQMFKELEEDALDDLNKALDELLTINN